MFQLTKTEKDEVVAICEHLQNLKFSRTRPYVFTEHGVIMAANILNSERAVEMGVQVIRAFVRLRQATSSHKEIAIQLAKVESHLVKHDGELNLIFKAIRQLMTPPVSKTKQTGFALKLRKSDSPKIKKLFVWFRGLVILSLQHAECSATLQVFPGQFWTIGGLRIRCT